MIPKFFYSLLILIFMQFSAFSQSYNQFDCDVIINGHIMENPFAGGINTLQVSSADLNFDGNKDLVLFDKAGGVVLPMINIGNTGEVKYRFDLSYVSLFPKVRSLMILRDFNGDGIEDLFCTEPYLSTINVYRGIKIDGHIGFEFMNFDIQDYKGLNYKFPGGHSEIYVGPSDMPGFEDVDGDGDMDILNFAPGGLTISFYKNITIENGWGLDTLVFQLEDDCWGKVRSANTNTAMILSEHMDECPEELLRQDVLEERHAGSATFCLYDDNGDGLMDLILGDEESPNLIQLKNGGTLENAFMVAQDTMFPSYNIPFNMQKFATSYFVDLNNDDIRDLIVSTTLTSTSQSFDNVWYYNNIGADNIPLFELQNDPFSINDMLDFGKFTSPSFVDENADGLIDIVVGSYGYEDGISERDPRLILLRNKGTINVPKFEMITDNYLDFKTNKALYSEHFAPVFGDLDNDGDIDLLVGDNYGRLYYLENIAGPNNPISFSDPIYPYMDIDVSKNAKPAIFDANQDGLMDLVIGEKNYDQITSGNFNYFQNQGSTLNPYFDPDEQKFPNNPFFGGVDTKDELFPYPSSSPCFVTAGEDYFLFNGSTNGSIRIYSEIRSNPNNFKLETLKLGNIDVGMNTTVAAADVDNDGYYELLIGNMRGGLNFINTPVNVNGAIDFINMVTNDKHIVLYPIPVEDILYLSVANDKKIKSIKVYNTNGSLMPNAKYDTNEEQLNVEYLADGVYFVNVLWMDGSMTNKKIIKL